jgi:hypothetical protein
MYSAPNIVRISKPEEDEAGGTYSMYVQIYAWIFKRTGKIRFKL